MTSLNDLRFDTAWVNGEAAVTEATFDVVNPASNEVVSAVADGDRLLIDEAISVAADAFVVWSALDAAQRVAKLEIWANAIESHAEELAAITTAESGKLFREARGEVGAGVAAIRWAGQVALRTEGDTLPSPTETRRHYTTKQPVGVVACITPWNFPIAAVLVKVGAALAAGCSVVVKPSEETPMVALALAHLSKDSDLPRGVLNVVPTSAPATFGDAIAERKEVRAVSFTGSTKVGKQLYGACANTMKRVHLELGGNAPFVVFDDADVDRAVNDAVNARFYNAGQICVGANRFFIHDRVFDEFSTKLTERVAALRTGPGSEDDSDLGPLINRRAKDHFGSLLDDAVDKGAEVLVGGVGDDPGSLFVEARVLTSVSSDMDVYRKEIFGPMACLYRFDDGDDVIALANDTDAGLAAYAYSQNEARLVKAGEQLEAGVVGLNTTQIFSSDLPFGGVKESGVGREHGENCLEEFLDTKSFSLEQGE